MNSKPLGTVLRMVRTAKEVQQSDLAKMTGFGRSTISGWEAGTRQMGWDDLLKVCDALGVNVAWVVVLTQAQDPSVVPFVSLAHYELWGRQRSLQ